MSQDDSPDSASVPLDDIETIKRRQLEYGEKLEGALVAIARGNTRQDRLDEGQLEILRILKELKETVTTQAKSLAENTEITTEVRNLFTWGKISTKFIVWAGAIAGSVAGFLALVFTWLKR